MIVAVALWLLRVVVSGIITIIISKIAGVTRRIAGDRQTAMAFIPTLACVQANLFYTGPGGAVAQNRLYCAAASPPTEADLTEVAAAVMDWAINDWGPQAIDTWELTGLECRAMNEAEGINFIQTDDLPVDGAVGSGLDIANQVTATVTLNTGLVGRSARGRIYIVGLSSGSNAGFRLTDAVQAQWQGVFENLLTKLSTAGHALQVDSFVDGGVPRAAGRLLPVTSVNVRFPLATQRRRLS